PPKRLAVLRQMAGDLLIGSRAEFRLATLEVFVGEGAERIGRRSLGVLLIERRILAESDARLELAGILARQGEGDRCDGPEQHPSLLRSDAVLVNPVLRSARSQPDSEAGDIIVEHDAVALAGRQAKGLDRSGGELHTRTLGSTWETRGGQSPSIRAAFDCWYGLIFGLNQVSFHSCPLLPPNAA